MIVRHQMAENNSLRNFPVGAACGVNGNDSLGINEAQVLWAEHITTPMICNDENVSQ